MRNPTKSRDVTIQLEASLIAASRWIGREVARMVTAQLLRRLLQDTQPVRIGSRALDILIALLDRPGALVTKDELMARVWPNTFVEPANLTVHIAALRRALGDGRDGNRFLINIPGRGYRFV